VSNLKLIVVLSIFTLFSLSYAQDIGNLPSETLITSTNLDQLQPIAEIEHDWPLDLMWSPDGAYLAVNTLTEVLVHQIDELEAVPRSFPAIAVSPWDGIGSVMFSPDSTVLATVNPPDGDLYLWSLTDGEHSIVDIQTQDYKGVAAISPDLFIWATAHIGGSIRMWDAQTGDQIAILEGHTRVGALAFSPDGRKLISAGGSGASSHDIRDTTLRVWDTTTKSLLATFELNGVLNVFLDPAQKIAFSPDGSTAAFTISNLNEGDSAIGFLDLRQMIYTTISVEDRYVKGVSLNRDGGLLAVGSRSDSPRYELLLIDSGGRAILAAFPFDHLVVSTAFSPDGTLLAVAREIEFLERGQIQLWAVS